MEGRLVGSAVEGSAGSLVCPVVESDVGAIVGNPGNMFAGAFVS
jgi:hypothetical protein